MDAVSNGTVECNHVLSTAYIGKNTALTFDTGLSFGLSARQHNAWIHYGGGMAMLRALYKKYNIVNHVCGNVGVQMGGWYRKEIKSVADLKGLNMRIGGIGGMVLSKLGAVPQQIPPGDIYPALEKGTIDAAEWIGPYDDEAGLQQGGALLLFTGLVRGQRVHHQHGARQGLGGCRRPIRPRSRPRRANRPCACWPTTTRAIRWRCAS